MKTFTIPSEDDLDVSKVDKNLFDFTGMKRVSLFNYCFTKTGGACDFECDKVLEGTRLLGEGGDGYESYPIKHSKFCVRACERFAIFDIDKAPEIIKLLKGGLN